MRSSSNLKRFARAISSSERWFGDGLVSETVQRSTGALSIGFGSYKNGTVEDPMRFWIVLAISVALLHGQQTPPPQQQDSIVVTGTAEPIPLAEADRDVSVIPLPEKQRELYNSWFDLLQLDPVLDLQQRALGGFQGDLSIRGATFGQTLILLNGMRVNDVQTGHFNLDLPVPLDIITGIEALKGSGSAFYGSDAIGGVVNVRAEPLDTSELRVLGGAGNFGYNQQHVVASIARQRWS